MSAGEFTVSVVPQDIMCNVNPYYIFLKLVDGQNVLELKRSSNPILSDNYEDYVLLIQMLCICCKTDFSRIVGIYLLISDRAKSSSVSVLIQVLLSMSIEKCKWTSTNFQILQFVSNNWSLLHDLKFIVSDSANYETKETSDSKLPVIGCYYGRSWNDLFEYVFQLLSTNSQSLLYKRFPRPLVEIILSYTYTPQIKTHVKMIDNNQDLVLISPTCEHLIRLMTSMNLTDLPYGSFWGTDDEWYERITSDPNLSQCISNNFKMSDTGQPTFNNLLSPQSSGPSKLWCTV